MSIDDRACEFAGVNVPLVAMQAMLTANLLQVQRMQLEALVSWQRWMAGAGSELWDLWTSHCAGGVPIDG